MIIIYQNGPLNYLTPGLKRLLLQRSIFDIMCDLWFIPTITIYISAILRPFLYNISPLEAKKMIDELPHECMRKLIFRKGLVNLLPGTVSATLKNNLQEAHEISKQCAVNDGVSNSGSTKSEEHPVRRGRVFSFEVSDSDSVNKNSRRQHSFGKLDRLDGFRELGHSNAIPRLNEESAEEVTFINLKNDVSEFTTNAIKPNQILVDVEEVKEAVIQKQDSEGVRRLNKAVKEVKQDMIQQVHCAKFDVIPISSSAQFHKINNRRAHDEFLDLVNVKTEVLSSNNPELVGTIRPILTQKQLGTLG